MSKSLTYNAEHVAAEVERWAAESDDELRDRALKLSWKLSTEQKAFVERMLNFHEPVAIAARNAGLKAVPKDNKQILKLLAIERELRRRNPFVSPARIAELYIRIITSAAAAGKEDDARKALEDFARFQGMAPDQRVNIDITTRGMKDITPRDLSEVAHVHQQLLIQQNRTGDTDEST